MARLTRPPRALLTALPVIMLALWWIDGAFRFSSSQSQSQLQTRQRWLEQQQPASASTEPGPVHIMTAYCSPDYVDHVQPGLSVLRSILAARENGPSANRKFVLHIIADNLIYSIIRSMRNASAPVDFNSHYKGLFENLWGDLWLYADDSNGMVEIRVYGLHELDEGIKAALGPDAYILDNSGYRHCTAVKLKFPFLLRLGGPAGVTPAHEAVADKNAVSRVLCLDADTVVSCDLGKLFDSADDWNPEAFIGAVSETPHAAYPSHYKGDWDFPNKGPRPRAPQFPAGLNGGVLLVRLDRLRSPGTLQRYWQSVESIVKEGGYASLRLGNFSNGLAYTDQCIENVMAFDHPEWFVRLPDRYNVRWWPSEGANYLDSLPPEQQALRGRRYRPPAPCIDHFSANGMWAEGNGASERAFLWKYWQYSMDLRPDRPKYTPPPT